MIGTFLIVWNAHHYIENYYFVFLGIAFFFVAQIGILHTLTYQGVQLIHIQTNNPSNVPTQLWLAARYMQAVSLLVAPFFINKRFRPIVVGFIYLVVTLAILASIFYFQNFPLAYQLGVGLTAFKIYSEYIINILLLASIAVLIKYRQKFDYRIVALMLVATALSICSELSFTFYHTVTGELNFVGHILMAVSFYFIYRAIVVTSLVQPHNVFFRDTLMTATKLKRQEQLLKERSRQLERERNEDEALLASIPNGVVALNTRGKILYTNDAFADMVESFHGGLRGKPLKDVMELYYADGTPVDLTKRPSGVAQTSNSRKVVKDSSLHFIKSDGSRVELAIAAAPILTNHKVRGVVAVYQDITEARLIERSKSDFISFAAHQLRTPLSTLQLTVEIVKENIKKDMETKKLADDIIKDVKKMTKIVDQFLNLSRIEMGMFPIEPEPTLVIQEIEEILDRLQTQILLKNLVVKKLYQKDLPIIKLDERVFDTVMDNIISNTIKYTPVGGTLLIEVEVKKPNIVIKVSDTGPGIPKSQHGKVFDKMYRGNNVKPGEGAGLGLYIVKSLLRQAGGRVWLKSPAEFPSKLKIDSPGTTFFISLPLRGMKAKEKPTVAP
jgi:PAS domain S-box-containing protein